jgi:acyl-[acyl-carrier-protein]-phospholipid O-acyltransferase/long-chain-fatty-acid--[acyl-carrier-protein] ligase
MSHSQFSLLKTRRFLPLFVTQFLGAFNDNVFKNALIIMMTYQAAEKVSVDPRLLVTASAGIFILPFFLFSAMAGQLADKFEKSRMIRIVKFIEIPLMAVAAIGFYLENYWLLMGVLFCAGTHSTFFGPLKYSILPDHLKEDELIGGNALVEAGTFLAILLGTIAGGVLILRDGGTTIVSLIITGTAITGWAVSRKIPLAPAAAKTLQLKFNFILETVRMIKQSMTERDVFLSIIGISWFWLVGFTFLAQFPIYAKDVVGADETIVTLFLTVFSVGIAIGSLICNKLLKGVVSGLYVPLGSFGMTAFIFILWFISPKTAPPETLIGLAEFLSVPQNGLILFSLLGIAVFSGIYIVPLYAIMQTRCDQNRRSRTIAANNIMNALFMVGGAAVTMVMLKLNMQVTDIFLTIGIVNIPVAFLVRRIVRIRRAAKHSANQGV